jgi:DnaJ-class molecular chaperone
MAKNFYDVLGVQRTASVAELKAAFRAIAMENHPDRHPGNQMAEARFKDAAEAYQVLINPEKRSAYDRTGQRPETPDFANVADAFKDLFAGWSTKASADVFSGPARDLTVDIELDFCDAALGCKREIRVSRMGASRVMEVKIPPGVADGTRLRLRGEGETVGSAIGDLYVNITVRPDPLFERNGLDLHTMAMVTLPTLVLGGTILILTPAGQLSVTVKAGTGADDTIVLKKLGLQDPGGRQAQGDLHVHLRAVVPSKLTREQQDLYTQLAACESGAAIPLPRRKRSR